MHGQLHSSPVTCCDMTVLTFPSCTLLQVNALQNAALPFTDVVSAVGAKRAQGINPIFQVGILV